MADNDKEPSQKVENQACTPNYDPNDPSQQEVSCILKSFNLDILGIVSLGKDGVLRSLTADRDVLSAEGMSPELIKAFLSRMPKDFQHGFEEADGTKTPREKWFKPDEGQLPALLAKEHREMDKTVKMRLRERMKEDERWVDVNGVLEGEGSGEKV